MSEPTVPDAASAASDQSGPPAGVPAPPTDPMKGFRGVAAGTLVLEAIVMALSLLVISRLYGGIGTALGVVVMAVVVLLVLTCGLLRFPWSTAVILGLQVVLVLCWIGSLPVGLIGLLFAAIWVYLFWLRRDVARRMAAGRLPSQQQPTGPGV